LGIAPPGIWSALFGSGFRIDGAYNLSYLLALYAITTVVYSLSVVVITFEMSYKIANTSWVQLLFSGVVIAGICRFHSSLRGVIVVQLVLMVALFVCVAVPFLIDALTSSREVLQALAPRPGRLIRRVSEDEVIAGFLKSDFDSPSFERYHDRFRKSVNTPDLNDAEENEMRRALLYLRHLSLWKELPSGTEWYEIEISEADLDQVRVFPRAQWRKLASGSFSVTDIAEAMRTRNHRVDATFLSKIAAIGDQLQRSDPGFSPVILIGEKERGPLTVLDGNHRLIAAVLASSGCVRNLRFLCGLSPRMTECCWYNTNLGSLFRYGKNAIAQLARNPEAELSRLLQETGGFVDAS
jgi:hypothetical protein